MLIELLCPKCGAPLDIDDAMKVGICPYCGTKAMISESIPKKIEVDLPNFNVHKSEQLTEYSFRMFLQGEYNAATRAVDDALKEDPDNTEAWLMYSVLVGKELSLKVISKLDMERGRGFAEDLMKASPIKAKILSPLYPPEDSKTGASVPILSWEKIEGRSSIGLSFTHGCSPRKDDVVHYYNWHEDGLRLIRGRNDLELVSGIHLFFNRKTRKYLLITIPDDAVGFPMYLSSGRADFYDRPGEFKFVNWSSDADTLVVNTFTKEPSSVQKTVDCSGLREKVEAFISAI